MKRMMDASSFSHMTGDSVRGRHSLIWLSRCAGASAVSLTPVPISVAAADWAIRIEALLASRLLWLYSVSVKGVDDPLRAKALEDRASAPPSNDLMDLLGDSLTFDDGPGIGGSVVSFSLPGGGGSAADTSRYGNSNDPSPLAVNTTSLLEDAAPRPDFGVFGIGFGAPKDDTNTALPTESATTAADNRISFRFGPDGTGVVSGAMHTLSLNDESSIVQPPPTTVAASTLIVPKPKASAPSTFDGTTAKSSEELKVSTVRPVDFQALSTRLASQSRSAVLKGSLAQTLGLSSIAQRLQALTRPQVVSLPLHIGTGVDQPGPEDMEQPPVSVAPLLLSEQLRAVAEIAAADALDTLYDARAVFGELPPGADYRPCLDIHSLAARASQTGALGVDLTNALELEPPQSLDITLPLSVSPVVPASFAARVIYGALVEAISPTWAFVTGLRTARQLLLDYAELKVLWREKSVTEMRRDWIREDAALQQAGVDTNEREMPDFASMLPRDPHPMVLALEAAAASVLHTSLEGVDSHGHLQLMLPLQSESSLSALTQSQPDNATEVNSGDIHNLRIASIIDAANSVFTGAYLINSFLG
jgi:hypothetical protein